MPENCGNNFSSYQPLSYTSEEIITPVLWGGACGYLQPLNFMSVCKKQGQFLDTGSRIDEFWLLCILQLAVDGAFIDNMNSNLSKAV